MIGFGACGDQRDNQLLQQGYHGEIGAIYLRQSSQRRGIGSALFGLMARSLLDRGLGSASLWVLSINVIARRFYEHKGGVMCREKTEAEAGLLLTEVAYGWRDLSSFGTLPTTT